MQATRGFDAIEAIAERLKAVEALPDASAFLRRQAAGQRNRIVVYLISETPGASVGGTAVAVQVVTAQIGVLILLPRRNDGGGLKARDRSETWTDLVRQALVGWVPPDLDARRRPLAWAGGELERGEDGDYWVWVDRYTWEWTLDSQRFGAAT